MATIALRNKAGQKVNVPAEAFAQSAYEHDVSLDDFTLSLNNFSDASISSKEQIMVWREECVEIFFKKMEAAGKLKMSPAEFLGGSNYGEELEEEEDDDNGTSYGNGATTMDD